MKLFIATPTFDGRIHTQYMMSILEAVIDIKRNQMEVYVVPNLASTLLILARNMLIEAFLTTDATHLMFIDSDLGFDPSSIVNMMKMDKDVIAGVYPSRKANMFVYNPIYNEDGSFVRDQNHPHLIKANMIPSGFMLIKREVILSMKEKFSYLNYKPKVQGAGDTGTLLFNTEVIDGEFWSEDYVFSKRARECGYEIWIDPNIMFDHAGTKGALSMLPEFKEIPKTEA